VLPGGCGHHQITKNRPNKKKISHVEKITNVPVGYMVRCKVILMRETSILGAL